MVVTEEIKKIKKRKWEYTFDDYLKQLFKDVKDTSKIHRININAMKYDKNKDKTKYKNSNVRVIIFFLKGKCYTTHNDGCIIVDDFLKRNNRNNVNVKTVISKKTALYNIQKLDPSFENDELKVFDVNVLKEHGIIYELIDGSSVIGCDDGNIEIDFYANNVISKKIDDNSITDNKSAICNEIESSINKNLKRDGDENYDKKKLQNVSDNKNLKNCDTLKNMNSLQINQDNKTVHSINDTSMIRDACGIKNITIKTNIETGDNTMFSDVKVTDTVEDPQHLNKKNKHDFAKKKLAENQEYKNDWTNEVVDNVIGTMFEYDENTQAEYEFLIEEPECSSQKENGELETVFLKSDKGNQELSRPFVCHYKKCNRAFKRFEHLKRHYRIHTGERPFKCKFPGCHKAFARSDNLNQHMRVHNTGGMPTNPSNVPHSNIRFLDDN